MTVTEIITHQDCLSYNPGSQHPEQSDRLKKVIESLKEQFPISSDTVRWVEAPLGKDSHVLLCHSKSYLEQLNLWNDDLKNGSDTIISIDADTRMSSGSLAAALRGVGAVCQAVDDIILGKTKNAFCALRPPGHHATKDSSMGFCFFGYAAIASHYALMKDDISKVAIVDFDVHHGNGTQELVEDNPNILFFSIHQDDLWPYQGKEEDHGRAGNIRNFPVPEKSNPELYHDIIKNRILPELERFSPDLLVISAGFDAHKDDPPESKLFNDPAGRQLLTEEDYIDITKSLMKASEGQAKGRIISILEGGYNTEVLAKCCTEHVKALVGLL